jgi:hypothetical protein
MSVLLLMPARKRWIIHFVMSLNVCGWPNITVPIEDGGCTSIRVRGMAEVYKERSPQDR